jgi:hypothetical protein
VKVEGNFFEDNHDVLSEKMREARYDTKPCLAGRYKAGTLGYDGKLASSKSLVDKSSNPALRGGWVLRFANAKVSYFEKNDARAHAQDA